MAQTQTTKYNPSPDWGNIAGVITNQADLVAYVATGGTAPALTALAALTPAANKFPYYTSATAATLGDITAAGRALIDDASASAQCTTLGLGVGNSPTFTGLTVSGVTSALVKSGSGGALAAAVSGVDFLAPTSGSAPAATGSAPTFTAFYGTDGSALSAPTLWLQFTVSGSTGRIPWYVAP